EAAYSMRSASSRADDALVEECRVQARLQGDAPQLPADGLYAVTDELRRAPRIVGVAGTVKHVEEHADLRHHGEQRVVAARALALAVVTDGRAFGTTRRAQHGP